MWTAIISGIVVYSNYVDISKDKNLKFISPNQRSEILKYVEPSKEVKLSSKEKKFIKKYFKKRDEIHIKSNLKSIKSVFKGKNKKYYQSLLEKGVIQKETGRYYFLGSDDRGRDLLNVILFSTKNNLLLALATVVCSILVGTTLGILQGYVFNRSYPSSYMRIKKYLGRAISTISAIPMLAWIFLVVTFNEIIFGIGDDFQKTIVTFILMGSIYYASFLSKAVEEHIYSLKRLEFLTASELLGLSKISIIWNHIIRTNLMHVITRQSLLIVVQTIMLEITISFKNLGFGLNDTASFGSLTSNLMQNPESINMMIPILFAGLICFILYDMASEISKKVGQ